ncbi:hypothetical protein [Oceanibaculum nanhaiense]|uniref:hypothetical protein n=1 Tax=Oceanibaculum nanhaiense TaxID=1909734 RepID=UPI00396E38D8
MIKWVDIVAPELREIHRHWCELRGPRLMPHLSVYNAFSPVTSADKTASAVLPGGEAEPTFRFVGRELRMLFPQCEAGRVFSKVSNLTTRATIVNVFHGVRHARQPDCRRGVVRVGDRALPFEQLVLPFANDQIRVCLIHSCFAIWP